MSAALGVQLCEWTIGDLAASPTAIPIAKTANRRGFMKVVGLVAVMPKVYADSGRVMAALSA
jgi:hypothetical protein